MQYSTVSSSNRPAIDAAILQAPVSDVECFEVWGKDDAKRWLETAKQMVSEGKGLEFLPRDAVLSTKGALPRTVYTAYRFESLFSSG